MIPYHRPPKLDDAEADIHTDRVINARDSGRYTKGELSVELASKIAQFSGYEYAIPFGQATHAIAVLARWYRRQRFRKMIVPAFTWPSTYVPFLWSDFDVRFCDIVRKTWLADTGDMIMDIDTLFCPVDTFGSVYDEMPLRGWRDTWIDSAQSFGSPLKNVTMNRVVSLTSTKVLTSAEGGMLLTQDRELAEFAKGFGRWYSRMSEFHAALGLAHWEGFKDNLEKKRLIAEEYRRRFPHLQWQDIPIGTNHYAVAALVDSPADVRKNNPDWEFLDYYQSIVNENDEFVGFGNGWDMGHLPNTEYVSRHILAFPSWPDLEIERIQELKL